MQGEAQGARRRRADAERSRASILDAATELLGADPECSVEAIAAAAGVTRQTVYAHFSSREQLMGAVLARVTEAAVAAMEAVDLDSGSATEALLRLLDASAQIMARHGRIFHAAGAAAVSPEEDRRQHLPVVARLERVITRGQAAGEFDDQLSPGWFAVVVIQLGHAAGAEVDAGAMTRDDAATALRTSVLRVLNAPAR
ncbi:hypothetical protein Ade02nite_80090 [Paractinoplanes deccanensis]|uniref:HTH tetR-type domain-containing protein n=1 Tax=Paractinoplanes deccanensis TaxID=113561 RepID=A0ABQ3YH78_9ACTN|nr:TetR/AcrR family transcriptional regulator [Actinoplanes deccanensis]GID79368.1 hypothetical protein Ade02nite_80090 [Actinoplanes deccanensis]